MGVQKTKVRAWHNVPLPAERLRFWSSPNVEIELAKEAGSSVFRLGIDWGRIVPQEPVNGNLTVVITPISLNQSPVHHNNAE